MQKFRSTALRTALVLVASIFVCAGAFAQSKTVKGNVKDHTGEGVIGASVSVKGMPNIGDITNVDGDFTISAPAEAKTLVVSYIGMKTKEVAITGETINITMEEDVAMLEEVVVIGYGTVKKRDLTGPISSVGEKTLKDIPVTTAAEAITGKMAGVQVTTTEGSPDADIKIRVRGGGSISQDNSPLYIVDGFQVSSISSIPPSDIESIDVLKDASSAAIYGSRGANGVVVITTKSGKEGRVSVNFNSYWGTKRLTKELDVMSPYEYVMLQYELDQTSSFTQRYGNYSDLDIYKSRRGTDWQNQVFGESGFQQYYNVGVNGGSKALRYSLSLTHTDENSIMINSGYQRDNLNLKLNSEINKNVSFDFNTRLGYTIIDGPQVNQGTGQATRLRNAVKYPPIGNLADSEENPDDDINSDSSTALYHPVKSIEDEYRRQQRTTNSYNLGVNWKIISGLKFRTEWSYQIDRNRNDDVWGSATSQAKNYAGQPLARLQTVQGESWQVTNTFTYDKELVKNHNFTFLLGEELYSGGSKSILDESRYFPMGMTAEEILAMFNLAGETLPTRTTISADNRLSSFFGRVNYTGMDKYLATLTFRADGSSKFARGNRWGYFPSLALAWRLSEESFMEGTTGWLSNLKLRASAGAAGNNRIDDGLWKLTYSTANENKPYYLNEKEASNLIPGTSLSNSKLKWETTYTSNVGLDFGLFKNRLSGTVEAYWNITKDLLVSSPISSSTGYSTQMQNIGQTSNKGIELTLEGRIIDRKDFTLSASFNIGINKNNVDDFVNGDKDYATYSSGWNGATTAPLDDYMIKKGKPVGQMYGYVTDGFYSFDDFTGYDAATQSWILKPGVPDNRAVTSAGSYFGPGALKFKKTSDTPYDENGKYVIGLDDKQIIGDANPLHTGGFSLTSTYKNIDVSAFFNWSYGNDVYNANKIDNTTYIQTRRYQNMTDEMSLANGRFTTIDPATGYNIFYGKYADPVRLQEINQNATMWHPIMTQGALHSWAVEDGSFLRLNTLTLGYTFPKKWMKKARIESLRIYATGYNVWLWTNYSGFDPEVDTRRATPMTPSVDYSAYPRSRSFIGGVNLTF